MHWPRWLAWDLVATLAFVAAGLHAHGHRETPANLLQVWWPFGVGLALGWFIARHRAATLWPGGTLVWASTLAVGMLLRLASHQGVVWLFVAVAGGFLALFLLAPRAAADLVRARRSAPS
jgi:hypothetical protein